MVLQHPYHSIYNLLAIRNAKKNGNNNIIGSTPKRRRLIHESMDKTDKRISVATKMIERLLKTNRGQIIRDADLLTDAYVQWANTDVSQFKSHLNKKIKLPQSCPLISIGKKIDLPIPTLTVVIDTSLSYPSAKLAKIVSFDEVFSLQGGLNLPKVIWCQSSDGVKRRQLVKNRDDLRQDSVMQQVFGVVNALLGTSPDSVSNKMINIRTYKIVPTSQTTGLIEWCEGTTPLGDWLAHEKIGAHQRYRPLDINPQQCKIKLYSIRQNSVTERLAVFNDIIRKIRPVLGHFLMENFPDPRRWFKARKSYIHSVAVNSMSGFILGLGDRHVQNILLDLNTAELIHIDLGIAFDQGRMLPTPELVPFRLTRDIVHAMGPFGVEGRFKSICCNVLNMLRCHKDIILILLEVLLHDPLHAWTLSPQQARLLQAKRLADLDNSIPLSTNDSNRLVTEAAAGNRRDFSDQSQMAERVILEISRKLSGSVDNSQLNVEGHVNYLIQQAVDINNLGRMFCGWQAYL